MGSARAEGFLARDPEAACTTARRLAPFLTAPPAPNRICTQVYDGPDTARITGTIAELEVERHLSRTDGCEIADWDRVAPLLGDAS